MLGGGVVGAAAPAGEILKSDTAKAEALPGVKAVWTTESRTVRFAGQDVAAVAAVSPEIAADAARLIQVTYDEKPYATEIEKAMDTDAPLVYDEAQVPATKEIPRKGNILGPKPAGPRGGPRGDVEKGLAEAAVKVEQTYRIPLHTHAPLDNHQGAARREGAELTDYTCAQSAGTGRHG